MASFQEIRSALFKDMADRNRIGGDVAGAAMWDAMATGKLSANECQALAQEIGDVSSFINKSREQAGKVTNKIEALKKLSREIEKEIRRLEAGAGEVADGKASRECKPKKRAKKAPAEVIEID